MVNEKRMINADDVERSIRNAEANIRASIGCGYDEGWADALASVADMIKTMPFVDAVEVVHGQWFVIEDDYFDLVELKCSVCGESWGFEDYEDCIPQNYHYCPNCGAKMDGDGNG